MIHDRELDGGPIAFASRPPGLRWPARLRSLLNLIFFAACGLVLIGLLLPSSTHCGEGMRRAQCRNNLKQIQLALESYHQKYGALPPAYVADSGGRRMHGWRVLILPFLDQTELYARYDFTEPWDGPHNLRLLGAMPGVFRCSSDNPPSHGRTCYVAITGPGTMFPGAAPVRKEDVADGLSRTLNVVETVDLPIPWTAPLDLDVRTMSFEINDPSRPAIGSRHPGEAFVATGDGRVAPLRDGTPPEVIRAMTTIAGGEKIDVEEALNSR